MRIGNRMGVSRRRFKAFVDEALQGTNLEEARPDPRDQLVPEDARNFDLVPLAQTPPDAGKRPPPQPRRPRPINRATTPVAASQAPQKLPSGIRT